jgi:hypothetical protein
MVRTGGDNPYPITGKSNNNCFWVSMNDYTPHYIFENSLITDNKIFMGLNNDGMIERDKKNLPITKNVQRSGKVVLNIVTTDTISRSYLHPSPESDGRNIPAGIFQSAKTR